MTQLEAALGTLLLIAIVVAIQNWVWMRIWRSQYRELRAKKLELAGRLAAYQRAWEKARTP